MIAINIKLQKILILLWKISLKKVKYDTVTWEKKRSILFNWQNL